MISVSIHHSHLLINPLFFALFPNVRFFSLSGNGFVQLCHHVFPLNVIKLDLRNNKAKGLTKNCFESLPHLKCLWLDGNKIATVHTHSFVNLTRLLFLSLAENPISRVTAQILALANAVQFVSFQGITDMTHIDKEALNMLNPAVIQSSDYKICCIAPQTLFAQQLSFGISHALIC